MLFGLILAGSTFAQQEVTCPSLIDFLNAQREYRTVEINGLNLVAAYLDAANQLNLRVGPEVIQ
jgi:hypothetical protein